jgi:hypothetical protein
MRELIFCKESVQKYPNSVSADICQRCGAALQPSVTNASSPTLCDAVSYINL